MWLDGQLTNFEYLMRVNMLCGRSFRHPALYPIFPWVILDFGSERADFGQEEMMRDLSYPITAQTPMQRKTLEEKVSEGECMYFTLPSNPTQVGHWLLRLETFTALHIDNEGGHFGCDSRLFTSMAKTTVQVLENQNCWEPMPEFYYLLEFFFDLNGIEIAPVQLPAWLRDAFEFVYQQRKALESDFVSRHLNKWIDLIFGIYLKNDTTSHFNSYSYMLHDDIWQVQMREVECAAETELIEVTLSKLGHLPPVVFQENHPEKAVKMPEPKQGLSIVSFEKPPIVVRSVFVSADSHLVYVVVFESGAVESLFIDPHSPRDSRGSVIRKAEERSHQITLTYSEGFFLMEKANSKNDVFQTKSCTKADMNII